MKLLKIFLILSLISAPTNFTKCNIWEAIKPESISQKVAFCSASALIFYGLYQHRDKFTHCLVKIADKVFAHGSKEQYGNRALIAAAVILIPYGGSKLLEYSVKDVMNKAYKAG